MPFKSTMVDQTVLRYRYYYYHMPDKVDGKGFLSHKSNLKNVLSDKKSNC